MKFKGLQIILLFAVVFCLAPSRMQTHDIKTYLGVGVITSSNSNMVSYAEVQIRESNGEMVGFRNISRDAFLRKAMGIWPSLSNPDRENLFEKNEIDCYPIYDSLKNTYNQFVCDQVLDLWKLRWSRHPYQYFAEGENDGWSQGQYKPSLAQQTYLYNRYKNANIMIDYFYGKYMFQLFKDMQDSTWRRDYEYMNDSIAKLATFPTK